MKYQFKILKGTAEWVREEICEKIPDLSIISVSARSIEADSDITDIEQLRVIKSALNVADEKGRCIDLSRRKWRDVYYYSGINPCIAYVMCRVARVQKEDVVLDPFCGSGVIPVTALLDFYAGFTIASDVSGKAIDMAKSNFASAGIDEHKYCLFRSSIQMLKIGNASVDKVITNLPFGIRSGTHENNVHIYTVLSKKMNSMLKPGGFGVLLTQEKRLVQDVFSSGYSVELVANIEQGGLLPAIYRITPKFASRE